METNPRMSRLFKPAILIGLCVVCIMLIFTAWAWRQVPEGANIPVHWGINGEPDRYGGKFEGLLMLPIIAAVILFLLYLSPHIEPRRRHLQLSNKAYSVIITIVLFAFAAFHFFTVMQSLGKIIHLNRWILITLGILFMVIGNYMGKIRSNFMLGIKTPWTLSSELSWHKTHRLGGWLFVILGFIVVPGAMILENSEAFSILFGGLLVVVVVLFGYSYRVWRLDPDKSERGTRSSK